MIEKSTKHCLRLANPSISNEEIQNVMENAEHEPCRIHPCDKRLSLSLSNASTNLKKNGLRHMFDGERAILNETPEPPPKCGLAKAAAKIKILMVNIHYRLYRGMVYAKSPKGKYSH